MGVMESEEKKLEKERKKLEADKNKLELEKEKLQLKQDKENFEKEKKAFNKKKKKLEAKDNSAEDSDQADDENSGPDGVSLYFALLSAIILVIAWLTGWSNWVFHGLIIFFLCITWAIAKEEEDEDIGGIAFLLVIGLSIYYYVQYIALTPKEIIKEIILFFS